MCQKQVGYFGGGGDSSPVLFHLALYPPISSSFCLWLLLHLPGEALTSDSDVINTHYPAALTLVAPPLRLDETRFVENAHHGTQGSLSSLFSCSPESKLSAFH